MKKLVVGLLLLSATSVFAGECDQIRGTENDDMVDAYLCDVVSSKHAKELSFTQACLIKAVSNDFYNDGVDDTYVKFKTLTPEDVRGDDIYAFHWTHNSNTIRSKYEESKDKLVLGDTDAAGMLDVVITKIVLKKSTGDMRLKRYVKGFFGVRVKDRWNDIKFKCNKL